MNNGTNKFRQVKWDTPPILLSFFFTSFLLEFNYLSNYIIKLLEKYILSVYQATRQSYKLITISKHSYKLLQHCENYYKYQVA